ncbi:MAG: hypothetical protein HON98_03560 [Chloroflexi bacterium]|jgi:hypothetical protein|nr:hypothetical protein [Chloroflexota bacterium]MBT3670436.1 hypothetical protein [Chloroflexota bacterium]MBT4004191.1 hypothetical protein [Chloroflexota bacterium]MBT4304662.1 hypothetical protein [Chloroflexota bacterium]MBT4534231.1 hypothetical protein [Chloroflexota bacterium]
MVSKREKVVLAIFIILLLMLITIPLIIASRSGGETNVFGGFLFNPLDSHSYISKMRQGFQGSWTFKLAYTLEPADGAFINIFYLFLGHIARWFSLPLVFTFHLFRLLFSALMFWVLFTFTAKIFSNKTWRWTAFVLASIGSGLGWLGIPFDLVASDLWVAEMFPFLSANTNAHFPIALALQLWILMPRENEHITWSKGIKLSLAIFILTIISPFGIVLILAVKIGLLILRWLRKTDWQIILKEVIIIGLFSGPLLIYYLWISRDHPVLSIWSSQNLTFSPPPWDLIISLSPALIIAFFAVKKFWRTDRKEVQTLLVWMIVCILLVYIPFSLQRRFLQGLFIPISLLAIFGFEAWFEKSPKYKKVSLMLLFFLVVPTNLLLLLTALFGVQRHAPEFYLSRDEQVAMVWINENVSVEAHFLASADIGSYIPSISQVFVYYGHPFETIDAENKLQLLEDFYSGKISDPESWLEQSDIEYIFYGPKEQSIGQLSKMLPIMEIYRSGDVSIFQVIDE